VPIKELSHDKLLDETASLADRFESDPAAYWNTVKGAKPSASESTTRHRVFHNKPVTALANLEDEISALFDQVDKQAIEEVFVSLLGYYFAKGGDMRVTRRSIYEGIQAWTTEACGLPKAPFVSESLLAKMGGLDGGPPARGAQRGPVRRSSGFKPPATRYMNSEQNRRRNEWTDRGVAGTRRWGEGEGEGENTSPESKWMGRGSRSSRDGGRRDGEWRKSSGDRRDGEWRKSSGERRDGEWRKSGRSAWNRDGI
jgi:ATP-dependent RNA helicase MSS116